MLIFVGDAIDCAAEKPDGKNPTTSKINISVPIASTGTSEPGNFSRCFINSCYYCDHLPFCIVQFHQYRALKLESIRKNLVYQKKFLSGIVFEWDQNHNRRIENVSESKKPLRRFRYRIDSFISYNSVILGSGVIIEEQHPFVSGSPLLLSYRLKGCATSRSSGANGDGRSKLGLQLTNEMFPIMLLRLN